MPHLVVREPGRIAMTVALTPDFTVGRDPKSDLALADRQVSRLHARFIGVEGGGVRVVDLGSRHGLVVNQKPTAEAVLADGDIVQVGNVILVYKSADLPDDSVTHTLGQAEKADPPSPQAARLLRLLDDLGAMLADDAPDALLGRLLETVRTELGCERAVIGIVDSQSAAGRRLVIGPTGDVVVSRSLLERVVGRGESVLLDVSGGETPLTVVREGVKSAMAAPLLGAGGTLGYIYVDDRSRAGRFAAAELHFLTALARLAAAAVTRGEERRRSAAVADAMLENHPVPGLLGESSPMERVRAVVQKYASAGDSAVLIRGESGTGKELVASTIHALSPRASQPFVTVNCAAIPDTLIESELFGYEKGAFTGAARAHRGKLVLAHRGTLFLDEIGDLSLVAQAKVLRAIEEGEVQPLGSEEVVHVDVRILSATHKSLGDEIAAGRFREDLYYRLAVGEIALPPLRARGDDAVLLARAQLARVAQRLGKRMSDFSAGGLDAIRRYGWPGNVRQLQNEIERAVILSDGPLVELDELHRRVDAAPAVPAALSLAERFAQLDVLEKVIVEEALAQTDGNVSEAARLLGVSRIVLRRRIERFGLREG